MTVVLALDLGTSFAKARRFDEEGTAMGDPVRQPAAIGSHGGANLEDVVAAAEAVVDEALNAGPAPDAVAVSSAWHTLVGLDVDQRPTTELSTWLDDRASTEAADLRAAVADVEDARDRVGAPIHPSFPSARILWIARHQPDAFAATRRWCSLAEVVASRWFGDTVGPSPSIASASGLYDQRRGLWDAELLTATGIDASQLVAVDDEPRRGLAAAYTSRWPALADVPWFPALGDGAAAVIGSGCAVPGRAALTVGTSAAVRTATDLARRRATLLPPTLFGFLIDAGTPVVGASRSNAGAAVEWAAGVLGVPDRDAMEKALEGRAPAAHGLSIDPSLVAERSPRWPLVPSARIEGMRRTTTGLDILQAFVEAVAFGIGDAVDSLDAWAGPQQLVLGGGASTSEVMRQLLADVIGRALACSPVSDESARGAALAASVRMGAPMPPPPTDELTVEPDAARAAVFAEVRAAQTDPPFAASLGP